MGRLTAFSRAVGAGVFISGRTVARLRGGGMLLKSENRWQTPGGIKGEADQWGHICQADPDPLQPAFFRP